MSTWVCIKFCRKIIFVLGVPKVLLKGVKLNVESTRKTENYFIAYVHIEYSTYQFSEELKGGGIQPPYGLLAFTQNLHTS